MPAPSRLDPALLERIEHDSKTEGLRRQAAAGYLTQYERGILTVGDLLLELTTVVARDFDPCLVGQHSDVSARVGKDVHYWQCQVCARLERWTKDEMITGGQEPFIVEGLHVDPE